MPNRKTARSRWIRWPGRFGRVITEDSGRIKTLVDEVNLGSLEQARGIQQIGQAIVQMERVTQTTAASAEEGAAAAEELTAQSETLKDIVDRLNIMVGGGVGRTVSHKRADVSSKVGRPAQRRRESAGRASLRGMELQAASGSGRELVLAQPDKKTYPWTRISSYSKFRGTLGCLPLPQSVDAAGQPPAKRSVDPPPKPCDVPRLGKVKSAISPTDPIRGRGARERETRLSRPVARRAPVQTFPSVFVSTV